VIVKEDLIKPNYDISSIANYDLMIKYDSMYNTGPTFPIFIVKEYAKFLLDTGGMKVWE
jgi:phosphoserine aminotransferase